MQIVFRLLLSERDHMLVEEYLYPHVMDCIVGPYAYHTVPVRMDRQGIVPEQLKEVGARGKAGAPKHMTCCFSLGVQVDCAMRRS